MCNGFSGQKRFFAVIIASFVSISLFAADLSFRITPGIFSPTENYEMGFSGVAQADLDLAGFLTIGAEGLFTTVNPNGVSDPLTMYGAGAGIGAYFYPLSRLYVGLGGSYGLYSALIKINDEYKSATEMYYRGYGEVGFRVNPAFTVSAVGGYNSYMVHNAGDLVHGFFGGLSIKYTVPRKGNSSGGFSVSLEQDDPAFPLFMSVYRDYPLGTLTLRNMEGADVQNVRVTFSAGKYTDSAYETASLPFIKKYSTVEVPLLADFSQEILRFTEDGKILGEVTIEYTFLGEKKTSIHNVIVDVYNRNAFIWADPAAMASFISPDTPEIQEFAKYVAGFARNNFKTGINRNFTIAANMAEAIRLSKIAVDEDASSPYTDYHRSYEIDSIRYPLQTMNMISGDYDELGILLASCLESVGVGTGYIPLDDDMIILVDMGIKPSAAANYFPDTSGLIIDSETVYFGISIKALEQGFTTARNAAFNDIASILADGTTVLDYYDTHEVWASYPPVVYTGSSGIFTRPTQSLIEKDGNAAVEYYINTEIEGVIANARKTGDSNKIGMALVRVGRYDEAKKEFAKSDSVSAMNNLANVYLLEKDYAAAKAQFEKALAKDPGNKTAKKGIEKCNAYLAN